MMRDAQRIEHMLNFVRRSLEILEGVDLGAYLASLGLQEQVELNMIHLGEAAARVSDEVKEKHSEIPWHEMAGMRNVLTHECSQMTNHGRLIGRNAWTSTRLCSCTSS